MPDIFMLNKLCLEEYYVETALVLILLPIIHERYNFKCLSGTLSFGSQAQIQLMTPRAGHGFHMNRSLFMEL